MEKNFNRNITRRDFIKLGSGIAGILLAPSIISGAQAMEYFSNIQKFPEKPDGLIYYAAHIENNGWTGWCKDGELCGTPDNKRPIGAMAIKFIGGIASYQAYLQGLSWTDWYGNGDVCGFINGEQTYGAFKIRIPKLSVSYRAHFYDSRWTQWYKDGKTCGYTGKENKILNAVEITCTKL
jgi:uncharacterized protein YjdB